MLIVVGSGSGGAAAARSEALICCTIFQGSTGARNPLCRFFGDMADYTAQASYSTNCDERDTFRDALGVLGC